VSVSNPSWLAGNRTFVGVSFGSRADRRFLNTGQSNLISKFDQRKFGPIDIVRPGTEARHENRQCPLSAVSGPSRDQFDGPLPLQNGQALQQGMR
jgi:hypothetical protein